MKKWILSTIMVLILFFVYSENQIEAISITDSLIDVTVISYFDEENTITTTIEDLTFGSRVSFDENLSSNSGYVFSFWLINGAVAYLPIDFEFYITSTMELTAVFKPVDKFVVLFMDSNLTKIDIQYITLGGNAVEPITTEYSKPGLIFRDPKWSSEFTNVLIDTICVLQYDLLNPETSLTLTVENGIGDGEYVFNQIVTITADLDTPTSYFQYWMLNERFVSNQRTFSYTLLENETITAVFGDSPLTTNPLVVLHGKPDLRENYTSYLGQYFLPLNYNLIDIGLITHASLSEITLDTEEITQYSAQSINEVTNEFLISLRYILDLNTRIFMIYEDNLGELHFKYSELPLAEGLSYSFNLDQVSVLAYNGDASYLSLPSTIFGYPVTNIESYAFQDCTSLTYIQVPNSVNTIGYSAFNGCSSLESMSLPFIGENREGLLEFGLFGYIFGSQTYSGSSYTGQRDNTYTTHIYYIPTSLKIVEFTDTDLIPYGAFNDCDYLTDIIFTDLSELQSIGGNAFHHTYRLNNFIIPNGVTSIGVSAFAFSNAEIIYIPDSVVTITEIIIAQPYSNLNIYVEAPAIPGTWTSNWNPDNWPVHFSSSEYFIAIFRNDDNSIISVSTVLSQSSAAAPNDPIKTGYTFTGWDTSFSTLSEDIDVFATYSVNQYTATFKDFDSSVLSTSTVDYLTSAVAPANPTREHYTFNGWDIAYDSITEDIVVTATYIPIQYTATFKDYNNNVLSTSTVDYLASAIAPTEPTRVGYTFSSWDINFNSIIEDIIVTATYTINQYTATFKDYDNYTLGTSTVDYLTTAIAPAEPTRVGYTFDSWDVSYNLMTENINVTAIYNPNEVTATFKDYDERVLGTSVVDYLSSAVAPSDPTRDDYDFTGWDVTFTSLTEDIVVTATYTVKTYNVVFTVLYNSLPIENFEITIGEETKLTNALGVASFSLVNDDYDYSTRLLTYYYLEDDFTIFRSGQLFNLSLTKMSLVDLAADLRLREYTTLNASNVIVTEYASTSLELLPILLDAGFSSNEIIELLKTTYSKTAQQVADAFISEHYLCVALGTALKDVYSLNATQVEVIAKTAGYTTAETVVMLEVVYEYSYSSIIGVLKTNSYTLSQIASVMKNTYYTSSLELSTMLQSNGYSFAEILSIMKTLYVLPDLEAELVLANLLNNLGYSSYDIAITLFNLSVSAENMIYIIKDLSKSLYWPTSILSSSYLKSDNEIAVILKNAEYSANEIAAAIDGLYMHDEEDVIIALAYAGFTITESAFASGVVDVNSPTEFTTKGWLIYSATYLWQFKTAGYGIFDIVDLCKTTLLATQSDVGNIAFFLSEDRDESGFELDDITTSLFSLYVPTATYILDLYLDHAINRDLTLNILVSEGFNGLEIAIAMQAWGLDAKTIIAAVLGIQTTDTVIEGVWELLFGDYTIDDVNGLCCTTYYAGYSVKETIMMLTYLGFNSYVQDTYIPGYYSTSLLMEYYIEILDTDPLLVLTRWSDLNNSSSFMFDWETSAGFDELLTYLKVDMELTVTEVISLFADSNWIRTSLIDKILVKYSLNVYGDYTPPLLDSTCPIELALEYIYLDNQSINAIVVYSAYLKTQGVTAADLAKYYAGNATPSINMYISVAAITYGFTLNDITISLKYNFEASSVSAAYNLAHNSAFLGADIIESVNNTYQEDVLPLLADYLYSESWTARDAIYEFKNKYGVSDGSITAVHLYDAGYTQAEIIVWLPMAYGSGEIDWEAVEESFGGNSALMMAIAMKSIGGTAGDSIRVLRGNLSMTDPSLIAEVLRDASYTKSATIYYIYYSTLRFESGFSIKDIVEDVYAETGLAAATSITAALDLESPWDIYVYIHDEFGVLIVVQLWDIFFPSFNPISSVENFNLMLLYISKPRDNATLVNALEQVYGEEPSLTFAKLIQSYPGETLGPSDIPLMGSALYENMLQSHVVVDKLVYFFGIKDPYDLAEILIDAGFTRDEVIYGLLDYSYISDMKAYNENLTLTNISGRYNKLVIEILINFYGYDNTNLDDLINLTRDYIYNTEQKLTSGAEYYAIFDDILNYYPTQMVSGFETVFPISTYPTYTSGYFIHKLFINSYSTNLIFEDMLEYPNEAIDISIVNIMLDIGLSAVQASTYLMNTTFSEWNQTAKTLVFELLVNEGYDINDFMANIWIRFTGPCVVNSMKTLLYNIGTIGNHIRPMYTKDNWYTLLAKDLYLGGYDSGSTDLEFIIDTVLSLGADPSDMVRLAWDFRNSYTQFQSMVSHDVGELLLSYEIELDDIALGFTKISNIIPRDFVYWGIRGATSQAAVDMIADSEIASIVNSIGGITMLRRIITISCMRNLGYSVYYLTTLLNDDLGLGWKEAIVTLVGAGFGFDTALAGIWDDGEYSFDIILDIGLFFCSGDIINIVKNVKKLVNLVTLTIRVLS